MRTYQYDTVDGDDPRRYLLDVESGRMWQAYRAAVDKGVPNPVVLLLDLREWAAQQLAADVLGEQRVAEMVEAAVAHGTVPTAVYDVTPEWAAENLRRASPTPEDDIDEILAEAGGEADAFRVVVLAEETAWCTWRSIHDGGPAEPWRALRSVRPIADKQYAAAVQGGAETPAVLVLDVRNEAALEIAKTLWEPEITDEFLQAHSRSGSTDAPALTAGMELTTVAEVVSHTAPDAYDRVMAPMPEGHFRVVLLHKLRTLYASLPIPP